MKRTKAKTVGAGPTLNLRAIAIAIGIALGITALIYAARARAEDHTCSAADVRAYEMILGVARGGYRTIPQLGFTIQYLGTVPAKNGACAVLVRRAD